jgi:transposase
MFIRETSKTDKKSGKKYISYQLVESVRTDRGPRQTILLTIGAEVQLLPEERKLLANRIEEILAGITTLFTCPEHIENLANHFAKKLLQKPPVNDLQNETTPEEPIKDFAKVDLNTIQHENARTIGAEYIAYAAYKKLNLDGLFSSLGFTEKMREAAAAIIISRAVFPASDRATHLWLRHHSGLDELMNTSFSSLSLDQLYRISDRIITHKSTIEKHLASRERELFGLQEKIILYDITNTYFEGKCDKHNKARRGKSKEQRSDSPLVALGVVIDSDGFPKHSEIFEGNVNERATLQDMLLRLNRKCQATRPIVVMDSGIATKENVEWMNSQGLLYIVMMKKKLRPEPEQAQEIVIRDDSKHFVSVSMKYDDETGDNLLYCYSEQRQLKEQDIKKSQQSKLEESLQDIKKAIQSERRNKNYAELQRKIGRLKQKYSRVCQYYNIILHPDKDGLKAVGIEWNYDEEKMNRSFNGTYSIRTNVQEIDPKKLWEIYMMLGEAEACFRCLKSEAGLRPNFHQEENRIDGHIFISILAYHLIACIRKVLCEQEISYSWKYIRERMQSHILISTKMKTEEGNIIHLRSCSETEPFHKEIYQTLNLVTKPIKLKKTVLKNLQNVVSKNRQ